MPQCCASDWTPCAAAPHAPEPCGPCAQLPTYVRAQARHGPCIRQSSVHVPTYLCSRGAPGRGFQPHTSPFIASLALRASIPETQLRRLINDCLGYRNFPSYVNAHRIAAAKSRLSDPGEARVSISTIAYDIGFASLGPFNRAFKEEAGVSPSEWRRKSLGISSPISEEV